VSVFGVLVVIAAVVGAIVSLDRIYAALERDGFRVPLTRAGWDQTPSWGEVVAWLFVLMVCGFVLAAILMVRL
jgi:hypothetical protein